MRIVALDIIRFFAAISVVLYHFISKPDLTAYPIAKFGYLGVPLFFMISGYVIALSANNRTAIQFAVSRFVRLYPALWAGILFTVIVSLALTERTYSIAQILANGTLLNDYLGYADVDGVYWTLKAELKFYACVFLLVLFGVFSKFHIWLTAWLGMTAAHAIVGQPFFMSWFITPEYSSFFIAGLAFFLLQTQGKNRFNIAILAGSLLLSSYHGFHQAAEFMKNPGVDQQYIAVAFIWVFYLALYLLCMGKINLKPRASIVTIGALTYPLYLIHNMAGRAIIGTYADVISEEVVIIIVTLLMILISWAIHLLVERPVATPMKNALLAMLDRKAASSKNNQTPTPSTD